MRPTILGCLSDLTQSLQVGGLDGDQRAAAIVMPARTTRGWRIQEIPHPVSRKVEVITANLPEIPAAARDVLADLIPEFSKRNDEQAFERIIRQVVVNLKRMLDKTPA